MTTTIEQDPSMKEQNTSKFVFWDKTRIVIMILCIICNTLTQSNVQIMNFTVICMDDVISAQSNNETGPHWLQDSHDRSLLFSAVAIGTLIGLAPSVPSITRFGLRKVWATYGLISSVGTLLMPLAVETSFYFVLIIRVCQGVGTSILLTSIGVISGTWSPLVEMSTYMALMTCSNQFASIITMPISGMLCESPLGWRSIYYIFGGSTLVSYSLFYFFYKDKPAKHRNVSSLELGKITKDKTVATKKSVPYLQVCKDKVVLCIWFCIIGGNLGFLLLVFYGPIYLKEILNFDVKSTGFANAFPFLLSAIIKFTGGSFSDRTKFLSERTKIILFASASQGGLALGYFAMAFAKSQLAAQVAYTFAIAFAGFNAIGVLKCAYLRARQHSHFVMAVISSTQCFVQFVMPIAVGFVCPDNTPEQWSRLFIGVGITVLALNSPFPFLASDQAAPFTKEEKNQVTFS